MDIHISDRAFAVHVCVFALGSTHLEFEVFYGVDI